MTDLAYDQTPQARARRGRVPVLVRRMRRVRMTPGQAAELTAADQLQHRLRAADRLMAPAITASPVEVVSFGYGHGEPPSAHITVDLRVHFKDPHVDPSLRYLTAEDARVVRAVMSTPGITELVDAIVGAVRAYHHSAPAPGPVTVAVGCVGGRHRGAAVAAEVARRVGQDGIPVTLIHRDMARPVIERPGTPDPGTDEDGQR
jgi:UPF0042 nucleotide-binding protein